MQIGSRGRGRGRSFTGGGSSGGRQNFQQQNQERAYAATGIVGATGSFSTGNGTGQPLQGLSIEQ